MVGWSLPEGWQDAVGGARPPTEDEALEEYFSKSCGEKRRLFCLMALEWTGKKWWPTPYYTHADTWEEARAKLLMARASFGLVLDRDFFVMEIGPVVGYKMLDKHGKKLSV